ncbi:SDR family oxidoreductase [Fluviicola chungangensis]|uniref:SDR family NAD(P)-dependent oxidoreductase n=1 Tax=Fluviicola chungangensis TaxID=2597671 RepID=A0A556MYB3_9FLAO|nr:SDR family NAD(P)-dependent oxidoreductase [Fluviicola chungangensis]TSJ44907.1 SDR family NAD(P)-dependent oxidoreductase [Fluviicola chungangensis]
MKTNGNTILITGGSAGIGFELAKRFAQLGNKVLITGRNEEKLKQATSQLENVVSIAGDVTDSESMDQLVAQIKDQHPELNMVINNAGYVDVYQLDVHANAFSKAGKEMETNYLSIVGLTEKLLPTLLQNENASVVNVTSIVAYYPQKTLPTYTASKAALKAYTDVLRQTFENRLNVFELIPPLVNTDFSKEIGGENGIPPKEVADELLMALEKNQWLVPVGMSKEFVK